MTQIRPDAKESPAVERKIGSLPSLWDRNAVFVGNLLSLFFGNARETDLLRQEVGSLETYGGRLIPILDLIFRGGDNLLVLEGEPDRVLCDYFEQTLHLSLPRVEIGAHQNYLSLLDLDHALSPEARRLVEAVRDHPAEWLDGFVTDEALVRLAGLAEKKLVTSVEGSRRGNNKYHLYQFLVSCGLPVFDTGIARDEGEVYEFVRKLQDQGYAQGVVKAQLGASGIGMVRLNFQEPVAVPEYLFHEGPCLVQGWLEEADGVHVWGSPSVQMFIGDEGLCLFDLTDQILTSHSVHEGNMAPPPYLEEDPELREELLRQGEIAARWLHEQGYRGTASVDFHVISRGDSCEVRVCEINARITGATYPSLLARLFRPKGAWLMRNARFTQRYAGQRILDALDQACLLYRAGAGSGILPINFNLTGDGYVAKGQFLAIGADIAEVTTLFKAVCDLESILWEYDRD